MVRYSRRRRQAQRFGRGGYDRGGAARAPPPLPRWGNFFPTPNPNPNPNPGRAAQVLPALISPSCPQLRAGPRAIRIKRVKEPLLLTFCSAAATASASNEDDAQDDARDDAQDVHDSLQMLQSGTKAEVGPNMKLDPELYEGVVTQTIIEPSVRPSRSVHRHLVKTRPVIVLCSRHGLWSAIHIQ